MCTWLDLHWHTVACTYIKMLMYCIYGRLLTSIGVIYGVTINDIIIMAWSFIRDLLCLCVEVMV